MLLKRNIRLLALMMLTLPGMSAWGKYDFMSVSPSGQKLYYSYVKQNGVTVGVELSYPYTSSTSSPGTHGWDGYTKPTGALTIPNAVNYGGNTYTVIRIGNYAFASCTGLTSVSLPSTLKEIGRSSFANCSTLTTINIPTSLQVIETSAFLHSHISGNIVLPDGFTKLERSAFGSTMITQVSLPSTCGSIGERAFECTTLEHISVASGNAFYCSFNGVLFSAGGDTLLCWPAGKAWPESALNIGSIGNYSVQAIGNYAFYEMQAENVTEIVIPAPIEYIGEYAFSTNNRIKRIIVGNRVESIGAYAFSKCTSLEMVVIGSGVHQMGKYAFSNCSGLRQLIVKCTAPPSMGTNESHATYSSINSSLTTHVPCGTISAYKSANGWKKLTSYVESVVYDVVVPESNEVHGVVNVQQEPSCGNGQTLIVMASAHSGYRFDHWMVSDGNSTISNTSNPLVLQIDGYTAIQPVFVSNLNIGVDGASESPVFSVRVVNQGIVVSSPKEMVVNVVDVAGRVVYHGNTSQAISLPSRGIYVVSTESGGWKKIVY